MDQRLDLPEPMDICERPAETPKDASKAGIVANNQQGIAALAAFCHANDVELVVMEATGGYEQHA